MDDWKDETAHGLDEFRDFPWERLGPALRWRTDVPEEEQATCWQASGISRGGITGGLDFNPWRPHIDFLKNGEGAKIIVDAWEIPEAIFWLVEEAEERGKERAQLAMRESMGAARG